MSDDQGVREVLTAKQMARRVGVSERMIRYAMRVQLLGIPGLGLAVETGTLPMVLAATLAGVPAEEQPQALAAAIRGEKPPKRPTAAERAAADTSPSPRMGSSPRCSLFRERGDAAIHRIVESALRGTPTVFAIDDVDSGPDVGSRRRSLQAF